MQKYEQFVAAVVAGGTLYVAELKRMLDEESVRDAFLKLIRIRWAAGWPGSRRAAACSCAATLERCTWPALLPILPLLLRLLHCHFFAVSTVQEGA